MNEVHRQVINIGFPQSNKIFFCPKNRGYIIRRNGSNKILILKLSSLQLILIMFTLKIQIEKGTIYIWHEASQISRVQLVVPFHSKIAQSVQMWAENQICDRSSTFFPQHVHGSYYHLCQGETNWSILEKNFQQMKESFLQNMIVKSMRKQKHTHRSQYVVPGNISFYSLFSRMFTEQSL